MFELPTIDDATTWMLDQTTGAIARAALEVMALGLRFKPGARQHLYGVRPDGTSHPFEGSYVFATRDETVAVHAVFSGGHMRVGRGRLDRPSVTVRLRDKATLRKFFDPRTDPLTMLLDNEMSFDGNLAYLARFDHLSKVLKHGQGSGTEPLPPRPTDPPGRWEDLPIPPTGEVCADPPPDEITHLVEPHFAAHTLQDWPRLKRLLWTHRTRTAELDPERALHLTEYKHAAGTRNTARGHAALYQAKGLHYLLTHKKAILHDDDVIAGTTTSKRVGVHLYPDLGATAIWPELLTVQNRELNPYRLSAEDADTLARRVFPFWMEDDIREWTRTAACNPLPMRLDERFVLYFLWKNYAISHTMAHWPSVLERGLDAIHAEARTQEKHAEAADQRAFYRALQVSIDGVLDYARRLAERAELLAGRMVNGQAKSRRRLELEEMARICRKVPAAPPESLHEAIQAIWIIFVCLHQESFNAAICFGRLDVVLEPYWQKDLASITDPAAKRRAAHRAVELCGALMLKATDHLPLVPDIGNRLFGGSSSDQVITLGGVHADGSNAVSDMTWIFLKAVEMLRLRDPNMNARYAPDKNSEAYLRRLCELNLLTRATPSIHNDDAVIATLVEQGFAEDHARDWSATGCVEPTSAGRHFGHTGCIMFNLVAPLEMALHDGVHPLLDEQIGPRTGDPRRFTSFDDLWEAYLTQFRWLFDQVVEGNNLLGRTHQAIHPTPLLSAVFRGPMQKGLDVVDGGAEYNTTGTALVSLTDVVDSLAAMKRLVFDQGELDMDNLLTALEADFVGYESVRRAVTQKVPKFGTGDPATDHLAHRLMDAFYDHLTSRRNYRGGQYLPGYWSMSNHVAFGILSGALPSGRRRGEPFTPGLTPSPLAQAPLTEQIRTVAELDALKMPNNIAFNIKLVPGGSDQHSQVLDRMAAYVQAYTDLGGMQIQFNVVSSQTLRHAMENPGLYGDLLVRISGYNAYFVGLNPDMQRELIDRMEHSLS
jgi:pyruvate formate-lyase/glycerol dehydratase family glycyl radical enzyme